MSTGRAVLPLLVPLLLVACSSVPERDLREDLVSLAESELAFARLAGERGIRTAFLEFLAPDSVIFRPGPVNGRAWFEARPERPGLLQWYPSLVEVSEAGDLGYTTGPSSFRADPSAPKADWIGYFVSVWRRGPNGLWKVAVDIGIEADARPPAEPLWSPPAFPMPHRYRPLAGLALEKAETSLAEAETTLASTARVGGPALAYKALASPRIRLHRPGTLARGNAAAAVAAAAAGEQWTWTVQDARVSAAGDLGYAYGAWRSVPAKGEPAEGVFLRLWQRPSGGDWRVVLDLADVVPPPKG
jgi:ketosteroid isomerase-like protein